MRFVLMSVMLMVSVIFVNAQVANDEVDEFVTEHGHSVKIHHLMHASIRIEVGKSEILIDPVRKLGDRSVEYFTKPTSRTIFITHEHFDHLDKENVTALANGNDNARVIANERCVELLGFGRAMANGDSISEKELAVKAVPAYNTTDGHLQFHPKGRDNGYILTIDGLRIYVAGDTEDIPELADVKNIDVAFLPCNQPYTMTVEQFVRAAKIIRPKVLFPYHYSNTDVSSIPDMLRDSGIDVRIRPYD